MQSYIYISIYIYIPTTLVSSHYIAWSEFIVIYTIFLYMYIILLQSSFAPVPANPRPQGPWLHDWIQHQWHVGDPKEICILNRGGKTYSKNMHFAICIFQNLLWGENAYWWKWLKSDIFVEICIFDALEICQKYAFYLGKMHMFCIFPMPQKCMLMELSWWIHGTCVEYTENMQKICILPSKMHMFCIFPMPQKCILMEMVEIRHWKYAFLRHWKYAKNMHFT